MAKRRHILCPLARHRDSHVYFFRIAKRYAPVLQTGDFMVGRLPGSADPSLASPGPSDRRLPGVTSAHYHRAEGAFPRGPSLQIARVCRPFAGIVRSFRPPTSRSHQRALSTRRRRIPPAATPGGIATVINSQRETKKLDRHRFGIDFGGSTSCGHQSL